MQTNALHYTTSRELDNCKINVNIRLSDDCKNGHADFAITADIYEKNDYGYWKWTAGGCCHEAILKVFPEFKPFVDLHLSDAKGAPMHAAGNGLYFTRTEKERVTREFLRISHEEYLHLKKNAEDELYFTWLLDEMGITARWKQEAQEATRQLEELTGDEFKDTSVRYQLTPLTEEQYHLIQTRLSEGYYLPENIKKRRYQAKMEARRKKIADLKEQAKRAKARIERELAVNLYVLRSGISTDSFIYYDHSNKVVFNWMNSCYRKKMTPREFERFLKKVDYAKLPKGIEFQLKTA